MEDTPAPPSPPTPPAPVSTSTKPSILNPEAVAEAHQRDDTATRAVTAAEIKVRYSLVVSEVLSFVELIIFV